MFICKVSVYLDPLHVLLYISIHFQYQVDGISCDEIQSIINTIGTKSVLKRVFQSCAVKPCFPLIMQLTNRHQKIISVPL